MSNINRPSLLVLVVAFALAACSTGAVSTEPEPESDLDALRASEADRLAARAEEGATEPITPRNELEARELALQDAWDEVLERHSAEQHALNRQQEKIQDAGDNECMKPLVDELIAEGIVPEGAEWLDFSDEVFPGIGESMNLDLSQEHIDVLAERSNGVCLAAGLEDFEDRQRELDKRQARELRALEEEGRALWDEQTEAGVPPLPPGE